MSSSCPYSIEFQVQEASEMGLTLERAVRDDLGMEKILTVEDDGELFFSA